MVYVINKQGQALMPTERFGKVRRLLKNSLAHVVCRIPFTIQLDYDTTDYTQPVSLGVDAGSKHIGISATTSEKELYAADVELRNDIVDKLSLVGNKEELVGVGFVIARLVSIIGYLPSVKVGWHHLLKTKSKLI